MRSTGAAFVCLAALASRAGGPPVAAPLVWVETKAFPAPEATQAAAADEHYVYAVESGGVAKYERGSGRRIAVSQRKTASGAAVSHLNSAFLRDRCVYCAHSNYPRVPEKSEILALDPERMTFSVFKDFGEYGGSLTWAVFHDGHWWCNFARYGDANGETFLVKFDPEWNERGRWLYPPELVRRLRRYSVSGGIWQDECLVVTGHDDPILFRLRLPEAGDSLELVDESAAPFAGQGIALEAATGGLVGIRRAKREVVFASPRTR